jgi:peroxiredoxin
MKQRPSIIGAIILTVVMSAAAIAPAADDATPAATPAATKPADPTVEEATLTKPGQPAPVFTVPTLDGKQFALADHKGQVVLVNWFATWCGPCKAEMPQLKSRVWDVYGANPNFVMVSVARGEDAAKVGPFAKERELPWIIGLDADKAAYGLYAAAYIPRNYVIGRDGRIIYQSEGFAEAEFAAMIAVLEKELAAR